MAVIGPNARSIEALQGNYFGVASRNVTFLDGIQDYLEDDARVYYAPGCHLFQEYAESTLSRPHERASEAIIAAKHADTVVMCLGLDPTIEGEQEIPVMSTVLVTKRRWACRQNRFAC